MRRRISVFCLIAIVMLVFCVICVKNAQNTPRKVPDDQRSVVNGGYPLEAMDEESVIPFEDVKDMFDAHKEELDLLYSAFAEQFECVNLHYGRESKEYWGGLMHLDGSYEDFETTDPDKLGDYIPEEAAAAVAGVMPDVDAMDMSYLKADGEAGKEAVFRVTLYPGVVSMETGATPSPYDDLWQELGDGWIYSVWQCPDG